MRTLFLALLALFPAAVAHAETAERVVSPASAQTPAPAKASYGPFRVIDDHTAALTDVTDAASPAQFAALLSDHPALDTLRFVECPGTYDDSANLMLGRAIRAAHLKTQVPADGSVRSGAVELVLAGAERVIDDRAEFAVHAWEDEDGREASDYRADSPENAKYLAYYREMGLADPQAFYAMTNSVRFEDAKWLTGAEMRQWIAGAPAEPAPPRLAYLDLRESVH